VPSTRGLADQDPDTQGSISLGPVNRSSNEGDTAGAAVPDFHTGRPRHAGPLAAAVTVPVLSLALSVIVRAASRYLRIGSLPCELFIQAVLKTLIPKFPGRVEAAGIERLLVMMSRFRSIDAAKAFCPSHSGRDGEVAASAGSLMVKPTVFHSSLFKFRFFDTSSLHRPRMPRG
jgi:hypothetical protein